MPTNTNTVAAVFTDLTAAQVNDLLADFYRPLWSGPSGEESTGEAVARHLEATVALLDRDGWIRTYDQGKTWGAGTDLAEDDSMTVKAMLKALLRFVRDEVGDQDPRRTLSTALRHVGEGGTRGDTDTASIASDVLDLVVRAHTGTKSARATPWSERQRRTHGDITALLAAGARFARTYGPGTARAQEPAA
ncbi:DUF6197 family protein [Streptomyces sp. NPDC054854]